MAADKTQALSNMTTRQKATAVVVVLVVLFLIWQVMGLFGGSKTTPATAANGFKPTLGQPPNPNSPSPAGQQAPGAPGMAGNGTPQQVSTVPAAPVLTQREADLLRLQQETEAKYLAALNELQMLKVDREIAETNKAIATAKLDMVTAQKGIVDLLTAPATPKGAYGQALGPGTVPLQSATTGQQQTGEPATPPGTAVPPKEPVYSVISVSQIQYRWSAVLGYQGNLYSIHVGDILPADGSKVISIDKSGVTLEKGGEKKKISMMPII